MRFGISSILSVCLPMLPKKGFSRFISFIDVSLKFVRLRDYFIQLSFSVLLVIAYSPSSFASLKFFMVYSSVLLLTAFTFAFNDLMDAPDDLLDPNKRSRNVICNGRLNRHAGWILCLSLPPIGILLGFLSGFTVGLSSLLLTSCSLLYSWRTIRLKSVPLLDLLTHSICVGLGQFLMFISAFHGVDRSITPGMLFVGLGSMASDVSQELRDFNVDRISGVSNTVQQLGYTRSRHLLLILVLTSSFTLVWWFTILASNPYGLISSMLTIPGLAIYLKFRANGDYSNIPREVISQIKGR